MGKNGIKMSEEDLQFIKDRICSPYNVGELDAADGDADVLDLQRFVDDVDSLCLTPDDGFGILLIDGKPIMDGYFHWDVEAFQLPSGCAYITPKLLTKLFGDRAKVAWYNR